MSILNTNFNTEQEQQLFIIRDNPLFIIRMLENTLAIKKDYNPLNNKLYHFDDVKSIYIRKENFTLIHLLLLYIFPMGTKNENILVIKTENTTDEIYLIDCNLNELEQFIVIINEKLNLINPE